MRRRGDDTAGARTVAGAVMLAALLVVGVSATGANDEVADGDRAWLQRSAVLVGRRADPANIEAAIAAYRDAVGVDPDAITARAKLLRALHFLAEFTSAAEPRKAEAVAEAVAAARAWSGAGKDTPGSAVDRAQLEFWSAIAWGSHAQRVGLLTIVREGVANRLYDHARRAVALDGALERGGGYRLLSRLHADVPRVPFLSGWVDRAQVLPLAERAFAIDPSDLGNRVILAMALLEHAPQRRAEAVALLEEAAASEPRPALLVEDLAIREDAGERLGTLDRASP